MRASRVSSLVLVAAVGVACSPPPNDSNDERTAARSEAVGTPAAPDDGGLDDVRASISTAKANVAEDAESAQTWMTALESQVGDVRCGPDGAPAAKRIQDAAAALAPIHQHAKAEYDAARATTGLSVPERAAVSTMESQVVAIDQQRTAGAAYAESAKRRIAEPYATFNARENPVCGVASYAARRGPQCGVERYNRGTSASACGTTHPTYEAQIATYCLGRPRKHAKCNAGDQLISERIDYTGVCAPRDGGEDRVEVSGVCQSATVIPASCESPEFGVASYNACRHPDFGVEHWLVCERPEFGIARYFPCATSVNPLPRP
jgi:hypothetical protein